MVGAQPLQSLLNGAQDGSSRQAAVVAIRGHRSTDLAGDNELIPSATDGLADDPLRQPIPVAVGGIEEIAACIRRGANHGFTVRFVMLGSKSGAEADSGDLEIRVWKP